MSHYIILDIETTGLDPIRSATIEIGAIKLINGNCVETYEALIKPRVKVEPGAFATHGISDEFLAAYGREPAGVFSEFFAWVQDGALVAHNGIGFDFPFLAKECDRYGISRSPLKLLDSLALARRYLATPDGGFSLQALCKAYQITNDKAHRALSDAKALAEVFHYILKQCSTSDELWRNSFQFEFHKLLEPPQGFEWLKEAIDSGEPVRICYETQGKPPARERVVRPFNFSVGFKGEPCLRAFCFESKSEKLFRLDRLGPPHHSKDSIPK